MSAAYEPAVTETLALELGLSKDEWQVILRLLDGRLPTYPELGVFSAMWSEHCSYKSSRIHLKNLPTEGPRVIEGPGENAGVVDIGDGWAVAFKMESHNHPSFIEPYQGAATGVGGILRDVFTMGARPLANLNSLRFGDIDAPRMKGLVKGVAAGIAGYGNCMGIPMLGGDCAFDASYNGNILVNAFTLGVLRSDKVFKGFASGVGNKVMYIGSKTGRDGIHGASMASAEFGEGSEEKRPTVQVGDPFTEKLLLEACLQDRLGHRHPGHGRRGPDLQQLRDGQPRRHGSGDPPGPGAPARGGHDALRAHAQRKPGAHAAGGPPRL